MTCEQFLDALSQAALGRDPPAELGLSAHAAGCPECASLWRTDQRLGALPRREPVLALSPALRQALSAHRPTRWLRPWLQWLAALASCGLVLALVLLVAPRADLSEVASQLVPPLGTELALFVGLFGLLRFRADSGLGAPSWLRWLGVALALLVFQRVVALQVESVPALSGHVHELPPRDCLALGHLGGGLVGMVALRVCRYTVLTGSMAAGALLGASAGYAALALLQLHCPSSWALHLYVAHGLPLLLLIAAGATWGRRWLAA